MEERFLVTGATGCIGAWVVRNLVRENVPVCITIRDSSLHRLQLIMSPEEIEKVHLEKGNITDLLFLERALQDFGATHVIHLAAMQLPFCKEDPSEGALVNVVGTINVFEAAKRSGLHKVVYSSSAAVYGLSDEYPPGTLSHEAPLNPRSHYGVYKQANEGNARVYWTDSGITSIGLRPYVVYGPGRDQGMTSTPTKAMLAAARGEPYHISFGGRFGFQYVDDVARVFIKAARTDFRGAEVFNIGGASVAMKEIVQTIEAIVPAQRGTITFEDKALPFPEAMDNSQLVACLGPLHETSLREGISETIAIFKDALKGLDPTSPGSPCGG
ncbi:MAG TPA: NAD(P)-dependent oxidoreductase [Candidatus Paceibacterota bacterium]|nr:NAD(P)-dependent oxidoreductase [Candidatus Paceibacterota bacterium]